MKKLFYLAVILCFVQVGITKAQTANVNDKQKQEQITKQTGTNVQTPSVTTSNESVTNTSKTTSTKTCTSTNETPSCCQKKGGSCCGGMNSTSNTKKSDPKMQKDATLNQSTGTTPK